MPRFYALVFLFIVSCTEAKMIPDFQINSVNNIPLVRMLVLEKLHDLPITVTVKGKTADMDIVKTFPAQTSEIPVLGLYPNFQNTVVLKSGKMTTNITITTKTDPLKSAKIVVDNLPTERIQDKDLYFLSFVGKGDSFVIAYDRKGDPRYYNIFKDKMFNGYRLEEQNGEIVIANDIGIYSLWDQTPLLNLPKDIKYHHDMVPYKNNYIILANSQWGMEDRIIEITKSGKIVRDLIVGTIFRDAISLEDQSILDKVIYDDDNIYRASGKSETADWAHVNSLAYDHKTDILYLSVRHQGVVAVKYSSWKLLWWMVDKTLKTRKAVGYGGVPDPNCTLASVPSLAKYRVVGDAFADGPKNQHALYIHKNGNIGMFDNAGDLETNPKGSRYVEYSISYKDNKWSAIKTREYADPKLYSRITSDVDFHKDGTMLLLWGSKMRIREINPQNQVIFDMQAPNPKDMYSNNEDYYYRVDKMPFFPYEDKSLSYYWDHNSRLKR